MRAREPNSWPIRCHRTWTRESGTGSQLSKYNSTCWRWFDSVLVLLIVTKISLSIASSDASDTMNFWNNRVNIYDKLSLIAQDILAAPASQACVERVFCVRPAYCWSQKQNDQVIANASLFETEQKVWANTGISASV